MRNRSEFIIPFIWIGIALWLLNGCMVSMACFEPIYSVANGDSIEKVRLALNDWNGVAGKTILLWMVMGGFFGLINALIYFNRPEHEHYTRMPHVGGPEMFGVGSGPKSLAETVTGFRAWFIGLIMIIAATVYVLPHFQTDLMVLKATSTRLFINCLLAISCVVPVLPFSLSWIRKKMG